MPRDMGDELESLSNQLIGAAIEVHRHIGPGQMETVYHRAMEIELALRSLQFTSEAEVRVDYKGHPVGAGRCDLLVESKIVVELKTVERLAPIHDAQLISYLRNTRCKLGLLFNFNSFLLKDGMRRLVLHQ